MQNQSTKNAWNRGHTLGELYRLKSTLSNQNEIIQNSKKIDIVAQFFKPQEVGTNTLGRTGFSGQASKKSCGRGMTNTTGGMSEMKRDENLRSSGTKYPSINTQKKNTGARTMNQLKSLKKNPELIKFYIRQKFGSDIPVNAQLASYQQGYTDDHYKVEKYLQGTNDGGGDSSQLCHLYDEYLQEIPDKDADDRAYQDSLKFQNAEVRKTIYEMLNLRSAH